MVCVEQNGDSENLCTIKVRRVATVASSFLAKQTAVLMTLLKSTATSFLKDYTVVAVFFF